MPLATYRTFVDELLRGVRWAGGYYGSRLIGGFGLIADEVAEGARQAFLQGLPGHPECMADSVDQVGKDRLIIKYRNDTPTSWRDRVIDAWAAHEQAGTNEKLVELVNDYLTVLVGFSVASTVIFEGDDGPFTVNVEVNEVPAGWTVAPVFGTAHQYGDTDIVYNMVANSVDVQQLRQLIRRFKRAATHAKITIVGTTEITV